MMPQRSKGTAARTMGIPPPPSNGQAAAKAVRAQPPAGDRWALSNAIDDRLGWMPNPEYRVLRVLFRYAGPTSKAWPGGTRIANACPFKPRRANRLLQQLKRWGVIENVRRGHKGSQKAGEWRIRPPSTWPTEKPLTRAATAP